MNHLEDFNIVRKNSILGVTAAQDPPLKNVSFHEFVSQQPHTLLKISSVKIIKQGLCFVST